jgi:hypothetical protein
MLVDLHPHPTLPGVWVTSEGHVLKQVTGFPDSFGYEVVGVHTTGTKPVYIRKHVIVCETFHGPRPEGCVTRHRDGDPSNNSEGNLHWGTQAENCGDTVEHGRSTRGVKNWHAVLTPADVFEIRARLASGESPGPISDDFGVSPATIHDIRKGRTWAWLKREEAPVSAFASTEASEATPNPLRRSTVDRVSPAI